MKRLVFILYLFLLLAACTRQESVAPMPKAPLQNELATIDTLMQTCPDSALFALLDFNETHNDLTPFDRHYADLLISEALFKSDYEQTTRPALRQSLYYFDSLADAYPKNDDCCLLSARSHYMNGVGLMEADSIVEACAEYLQALETVENHFDEKEIVGYKAKFVALTYNRLGDLFSDQFMMESAIAFYQKSLVFGKICTTSKYGISRTCLNIGQQFDMMGNADSAEYYFNQGFNYLPDTNNVYYRDLASAKALLAFFSHKDAEEAFRKLKIIKDLITDEDENLTRNMTIGSLYFYEREYDSALAYLGNVFENSTDQLRRLQAASCLSDIYDSLGLEKEGEIYYRFLAQQTMPEYENRKLLSKLGELYQQYIQWQQEKVFSYKKKQAFKWVAFAIIVVVVIFLYFIIISKCKAASQKKEAERLMEKNESRHKLEMQEIQEKHQATQNVVSALSGRLKKSNTELRKQKEQTEILLREKKAWLGQESWNSVSVFLEEDICKDILELMQGKNVKREAKIKDYAELKLDHTQLLRLNAAAEKHFKGLGDMLIAQYPKMTKDEMSQCLLYLLDFDDKQVAALLGVDYSTIKKRSAKMKKALGTDKEIPFVIKEIVL